MSIYFTSDLHFGGEKIIKDRHEFSTVEEMDSILIENWNKTVSNDDDIYIVGDLAGSYCKNIKDYICQLNGRKHLILGNHDEQWVSMVGSDFVEKHFESVSMYRFFSLQNLTVTLCHYPMLEWWESHRSHQSFMLHGHIHNRKNRMSYQVIKSMPNRILNCCPDINMYRPVTINELIENNKQWYGKN